MRYGAIAPAPALCYTGAIKREPGGGKVPRLKLSKTEEIPMEASTVYYTDFRCPVGTSLTEKLRRLCIAAGIKSIDMDLSLIHI